VGRIAGCRGAFGTDGVTEVEGPYVGRSGYEAVADALRKAGRRGRFTAVFAASDLMARGAVAALEDAGLRVPDDVSVAGFDDIMLAGRVHPSLTTVHQPAYDIGRTAAAQLLQYVHRGEVPPASRHILPVRLKPRAS
ncbi:LacI family transcriptional regulator, partial [Streptomyces sp. JV178]|uniref:substrate-binding domain-containing protein n=1 Tax=Streptomyces sp. JV178 TaxID=858632 RepID=UPI000C4D49B6